MSDWNPNTPDSTNLPPPLSSSGGAATATCVECGKTFPADEMIRHGEVSVCAACKPVFMQKLAEGAAIGGAFRYAGFWIRFAAIFIDGIFLGVVGGLVGLLFGVGIFSTMTGAPPQTSLAMQITGSLIGFVIGVSYETFMVGKWGATLGKMACKIKVIMPDGGKVSYPRALGRYFGKLLSYLTLYIGFIIAGFDNEKRALHDRICTTRVIYK